MGENVMDLNKLEVLAPAGDYERLCAALDYGALTRFTSAEKALA